jgi:hypothetical protein
MTRTRTIFFLFLVIGFTMFAGSALAQRAPNSSAEAQWNRYLANHPGAETNPNYLASHPGAAEWLQQHPDVASYARQQGEIGGRNGNNRWYNNHRQYNDQEYNDRRYGDRRYGDRQYNDPDWVKNHPNQAYENHPPYHVTGPRVSDHGYVGTAPVEHGHWDYNNGNQNNGHHDHDHNHN